MRKVENFFRGEGWLHLTTMFFIMVMIIQIPLIFGVKLPIWILLVIPIFTSIFWEVLWNKIRMNPINLFDIVYTVTGGYLAILILKI